MRAIKSFFFHDQHAKHLSLVGILQDFRLVGNILLHLAGGQLAEGMGLITKRIGKPLGSL